MVARSGQWRWSLVASNNYHTVSPLGPCGLVQLIVRLFTLNVEWSSSILTYYDHQYSQYFEYTKCISTKYLVEL